MNIAIVGLGYWGPNLARNFLGNQAVTSVILCDKDETRLSNAARKFPGIATTPSYDEILANPDIAAIVIATPVFLHYSLAKQALEAGKHVLMEKPFTRTVAEAQDLIDTAKNNNLVLMVDHTFLFTGAVQKMKSLLESDAIGEVLYFDSVRANLGLFQPDVNVIWDLAPHDISILNHLIPSRPISVSAVGMSHYYNLENIAYVAVHYAENIIAHFHVNWLSPVKLRTICVGGKERMIYYDDMQTSEKVRVYDKGVDVNSKEGEYNLRVQYRSGDMFAPQISNKEALAEVVDHFIGCIKTGATPLCDGVAGRDVVAILEAAELSLQRNGERVLISELG